MLLALVERRRNVAAALAALIADRRDPSHIRHMVADVVRARMPAIGCGYPDGNDFDWLRRDTNGICARSRPSRVGRMRRRCARSFAAPARSLIFGARAIGSRASGARPQERIPPFLDGRQAGLQRPNLI
jgi:hypothetical protein